MSKIKKVGLAVDNGGSELRTIGLCAGPSGENVTTIHDNNFCSIAESDYRAKEVQDPSELCKIIKAPREEYKGVIARGMTATMYPNTTMKLSSREPKTSSLNYYRTFIYSIAHDALRRQGYLESGKSRAQADGVEDTLYDYSVVCCIPIREYAGAIDCVTLLKESLAGAYKVQFPLIPGQPTVEFVLTKDYIGVVPEGAVVISMLKDIKSEDLSIIIDVGYITTDISLFKGRQLFGNYSVSSRYAGYTLVSSLSNALADIGYTLTEEAVMSALETGFVMKGSQQVSVHHLVEEAKKRFATNFLSGEVAKLITTAGLSVQQIQNVVPLGGPMTESKETGSLCKYTVEASGLKDASIRVISGRPRLLNVQQTAIFAEALFKKMNAVT